MNTRRRKFFCIQLSVKCKLQRIIFVSSLRAPEGAVLFTNKLLPPVSYELLVKTKVTYVDQKNVFERLSKAKRYYDSDIRIHFPD